MTPDPVEVWLIQTDLPEESLACLEGLLDESERRRAGAYLLPVHRRRFVVTHGAARVIIGGHLGAPPRELRWRRGPHGKPELAGRPAGLRFSLSSSGSCAALALSPRRSVGVDVQQCPDGLDVSRLAPRFYPPDEARFVLSASSPQARLARFIRLWARKEACVKVSGGRLIPGLLLPVRGRGHILVDTGEPAGGPCLVGDVAAPAGFHAAVALEGARSYRVTRRHWPATKPPESRYHLGGP